MGKNNRAAAKVDTQSPMRVARLADCESSSAIDLATIGKIAESKTGGCDEGDEQDLGRPKSPAPAPERNTSPASTYRLYAQQIEPLGCQPKGSPKINKESRFQYVIAEVFCISFS